MGRLISVAGASMTVAVVTRYSQYLIQHALSHGAWGGAGIIPIIFLLRLTVAGWVVWAIVKLDARALLRVLLAAFGASFLLLYGWYFLMLGMDDVTFYLAVSADLLYLIAALVIGSALTLSRSTRNGRLEA